MISPTPTAKIKSQKVDKSITTTIISASELSFIGPSFMFFGNLATARKPL